MWQDVKLPEQRIRMMDLLHRLGRAHLDGLDGIPANSEDQRTLNALKRRGWVEVVDRVIRQTEQGKKAQVAFGERALKEPEAKKFRIRPFGEPSPAKEWHSEIESITGVTAKVDSYRKDPEAQEKRDMADVVDRYLPEAKAAEPECATCDQCAYRRAFEIAAATLPELRDLAAALHKLEALGERCK